MQSFITIATTTEAMIGAWAWSNNTTTGASLGGVTCDLDLERMRTEEAIIGTILSIFIAFAIFGNVVVMAAVTLNRHLRKTSNYFVVSLAMADTLVACLVMTFALVNDLQRQWIFGPVFCRIWISSDVMCSTASILNLCAISLDRYIHIRWPLHYERLMTSRRTQSCVALIWILSALISFVPIHLGWHRFGSVDEGPSQDQGDSSTVCKLALSPSYAVGSSIVSFFAPCLVMILIYARLYRYARMHATNIRRFTLPVSMAVSTRGVARASEHKASFTLGVIMGVFLLCWAPFFAVNVVRAFCAWCVPAPVFAVFSWLGYLNSTMNPVIYCIFNHEFRHAFRKLLCPLRRRGHVVTNFRQNERTNRMQNNAFEADKQLATLGVQPLATLNTHSLSIIATQPLPRLTTHPLTVKATQPLATLSSQPLLTLNSQALGTINRPVSLITSQPLGTATAQPITAQTCLSTVIGQRIYCL